MSETPWQRVKDSKSKAQERLFSRRSDVRPQINSGRIWNSLRDAKMKSFVGLLLIDNKTLENSENDSYRITRKDWGALRRDANRTPPGCHPALQIDLKDIHLLCFELALWDDIQQYVFYLESRIEELENAT